LLPNAAPQPLPEAGARDERRLEAVGCRRLLGTGPGTGLRLGAPHRPPHARPQAAGTAPRACPHWPRPPRVDAQGGWPGPREPRPPWTVTPAPRGLAVPAAAVGAAPPYHHAGAPRPPAPWLRLRPLAPTPRRQAVAPRQARAEHPPPWCHEDPTQVQGGAALALRTPRRWGRGGRVPRDRRPRRGAAPASACLGRGGTLPAPEGACTPSQGWQDRLAWAGTSPVWCCLPHPWCPTPGVGWTPWLGAACHACHRCRTGIPAYVP
jgi:hypothetical protein